MADFCYAAAVNQVLQPMPHRSHLFSLRFAHAFREACLGGKYTSAKFSQDLLAGITVGIIAIPLAMALAIASGVPPQHGLYTAAIGGFLISFLGGSRFSVSGPTAAFVVILHPIAIEYGLAGLLIASVLAGFILVLMAILRLGRLIEYIPESVTLGFTSGIGVVIAFLQIDDFMGLGIGTMPEAFVEKLWVIGQNLFSVHGPSLGLALATLAIMLLWPRLKTPVPAHLIAVIAGSLLAILLASFNLPVDTIGSRFSYVLSDGTAGQGIPPVLPSFIWPWQKPGPGGEALVAKRCY